MWILGVETSGLASSVVLQRDHEFCGEISLCHAGRQATNRLIPAVQQLLSEANLKPEQVNLLAVTIGPGSFTGLRIGLTFAKTFGYVTGCPLVGVETFSALTEKIPTVYSRLEVVEDLRQGYVAWQTFQVSDNSVDQEWVPANEIQVEPVEVWRDRDPQRGVLTGGGFMRLQKSFPGKVYPAGWKLLPAEFHDPTGREVIRAGLKKWRAVGSVSPFELSPVYLRRSAAEENRDLASDAILKN